MTYEASIDRLWTPVDYETSKRWYEHDKCKIPEGLIFNDLWNTLQNIGRQNGITISIDPKHQYQKSSGYWVRYKSFIHIRKDDISYMCETLIHELGHAFSRHIGSCDTIVFCQMEVQAETISALVWEQLGLPKTPMNSQNYINYYASYLPDIPKEIVTDSISVADYLINRIKEY